MNSADLVAKYRFAPDRPLTMPTDGKSIQVAWDDFLVLADRIVALEARLAEAMEVLRPFNAIAQAVFYIDEDGREMNASRADDLAVWGFDRAELTYGHLRAARRLVEKEDGR